MRRIKIYQQPNGGRESQNHLVVLLGTMNDSTISLKDIFVGAFPFAVIMLMVLILLIAYPLGLILT